MQILITTNCVINQVKWYYLRNCFIFCTKLWLLQVIKSHSCGISIIFYQCCFMTEAQVSITVSDFSKYFSRNHILEVDFTFQWGRLFLRLGAFIFKCGGAPCGALVLMGEVSKNILGWRGRSLPPWSLTMGKPDFNCSSKLFFLLEELQIMKNLFVNSTLEVLIYCSEKSRVITASFESYSEWFLPVLKFQVKLLKKKFLLTN